MPSLTKLISGVKRKEVLTGEIVQRQKKSMYQVKIGNRTLLMQSLVQGRLSCNSQVLVVKTDAGYCIVNKEQIKDRQPLEVVVNG